MIKRALDAGAHGIIVPLLQTPDDARNIVKYAKFPPTGTRGFGSPFSMEKFISSAGKEVSSVQYLQEANSATVVVVQIETKSALESVQEIAAVDGVDVLLIGPFDLGNNIGHPILSAKLDDELVQAIDSIHAAAQAAGKRTGIYCNSGEQAREYADKGFHMISAMTDMVAVPKAFGQALEAAKGSYLHAGVKGIKEGVSKMTGPYGK